MTAGREKAMREPLARVEKAHGSFVLFIGTTPLECWDIKHNAEVTRDFVNDFAESWYQSRSKPLVEALRAVEFVDSEYDGQCESVCPWCYGSESRGTGHKKTCLRQQALEAHNG